MTAEEMRLYRRSKLAYYLRLMLLYAYHVLGFKYHWTLTLRDSVSHYEFLKAMRRLHGFITRRDGSAIYVKEFQKRGVVHVHLVTDIRLDHSDVEKCWGLGFVWVREIVNEKQLAYLTKYLTKSFHEWGRYVRVWGVWNIKRKNVKVDIASLEEVVNFLSEAASECGLRFEVFVGDDGDFFIRFAFDPYTYEDLQRFVWFRESYRSKVLEYLLSLV